MTHIALVTTSYPDHHEGEAAAGSFVADFASELARFVSVTVVAPAVNSVEIDDGLLRVNRFSVPRLPLSLLNPNKPSDWLPIFTTLASGRKCLHQVCANQKIDHILALWALPSGWWAQHERGPPYSIWALGSDIWTLGRVPLVRTMLSRVLRGAEHCFADGLILADNVKALSSRRCSFLPSARSLPVIPKTNLPVSGPYRLAYVGRWHPNKGIDLLLDALELLDETTWTSIEEVRIAGGGPLDGPVRAHCTRLKAAGRPIVAMGYLDKTGAAGLFNWADWVLIPSRIESIPVVFSDAMQAGCPIICSPVGDLPRLVTNYRVGEVAKAVGAREFAIVLSHALCNSPASMQDGLRAAAKDFDPQQAANIFLRSI